MFLSSLTACVVFCAVMPAPDMDMSGMTMPAEIQSELSASASSVSGKWLHSYDEAKRLANETGLPLVLHFEAKWCGPCRKMETEVLSTSDVRKLLGEAFIGVRIDSDRNRSLVSEFGVSTLPTEIIVKPDNQKSRHVGAVGLSTYLSRIRGLRSDSAPVAESNQVADSSESDADESVRSCLIVKRDGKMVGLGGYSPVALTTRKEWVSGSEQFVVTHEGVDYFLESATEAELFSENPAHYIPHMHGCDVVELSLGKRALAGSIEYGSIYRGQLYFFASQENRRRFQNHPSWYANSRSLSDVANSESFPFLENGQL